MAHFLGFTEAVKIVDLSKNDKQPHAQAEGLAIQGRWLLEHDLGLLDMEERTKELLESV